MAKKKKTPSTSSAISAETYMRLKKEDKSGKEYLKYHEYIVILGINPGERTKVSIYGIGKNAHDDVERYVKKNYEGCKVYKVDYV